MAQSRETIGTAHFVSFDTAVSYYSDYHENLESVKRKLIEGSIHIGAPTAGPGENVITIDDGRRYALTRLYRSSHAELAKLDNRSARALRRLYDALDPPSLERLAAAAERHKTPGYFILECEVCRMPPKTNQPARS